MELKYAKARKNNQQAKLKSNFKFTFLGNFGIKIDLTSIGAMRNKLLNFGGTDGTHLYVKKQKCQKVYASKTRINGIADNFKIYDMFI